MWMLILYCYAVLSARDKVCTLACRNDEAVPAAGRCERNRDTALRSYYKRKAEQERLKGEVRRLLVSRTS